MPGLFLKIPVFLGDCFIMPHPVYLPSDYRSFCSHQFHLTNDAWKWIGRIIIDYLLWVCCKSLKYILSYNASINPSRVWSVGKLPENIWIKVTKAFHFSIISRSSLERIFTKFGMRFHFADVSFVAVGLGILILQGSKFTLSHQLELSLLIQCCAALQNAGLTIAWSVNLSSSTFDLLSANGNQRSDLMSEPVKTLSRWTYYVKTSTPSCKAFQTLIP